MPPSDSNATFITSTVIIRVTPQQDHLVSWSILGVCFFVATVVGVYQVWKEHQLLTITQQQNRSSSPRRHSNEHNHGYAGYGDVESQAINEAGVSTADLTRCMFRRLLVVAMTLRLISIPILIWSYPLWWQFVGDTLPEMIFCSAWTLLVSFFAQLVGIAAGTGTNTLPGVVILATSFVVYIGLVILQLFNSVASVLLYALLCCIYAGLLGTISVFCPKLLTLLKPSWDRPAVSVLSSSPSPAVAAATTATVPRSSTSSPSTPPTVSQQNSPAGIGVPSRSNNNNNNDNTKAGRQLAFRLTLCTVVCIVVFLAHVFGFARMVISVPRRVYWWWNYGALELAPSAMFLWLMTPTLNKQHHHHHEHTGAGAGIPSSGSGGGTGSAGATPEQFLYKHYPNLNHAGAGAGSTGGGGSGSVGSSPVTRGGKSQTQQQQQQYQQQPYSHEETGGLLATSKRAVAAATNGISAVSNGAASNTSNTNTNLTGGIKRVDSSGSANTFNSRGGGGGGGTGGGGRMPVGSSMSSITAGVVAVGTAGTSSAAPSGGGAVHDATSFLRSGGMGGNHLGYGAAASNNSNAVFTAGEGAVH